MNNFYQKRTLIAAHRGASSGNIPCNSMAAFECALQQKADIIELDVSRTTDGKLFVFHPKMEPVFLGSQRLISEMTSAEAEKLRFLNLDRCVTSYPVERLEDVLRALRGRCLINIDKFWGAPLEIGAVVRELGMQDQVLVKSRMTKENLQAAEEYAKDIPYMALLHDEDHSDELLPLFHGRWAGAEACFCTEDAPVAQTAFIEKMHRLGAAVWVNALVYDERVVLAAGHNDDRSAAGDPDGGWGWLIDRGFDIIQTDFPLMLKAYLLDRNGSDSREN